MLEIYFNIIDKLDSYLINNLGFTKDGTTIVKHLTPDEYPVPVSTCAKMLKRKAWTRKNTIKTIERIIVEKYILSVVMPSVIDNIDWTPEERHLFTSQNRYDEREEERAYAGWSNIKEWIEIQTITVNTEDIDKLLPKRRAQHNKTRKEK